MTPDVVTELLLNPWTIMGAISWFVIGTVVLAIDWTDWFDLTLPDLFLCALAGWAIWPMILGLRLFKRLGLRFGGEKPLVLWRKRS